MKHARPEIAIAQSAAPGESNVNGATRNAASGGQMRLWPLLELGIRAGERVLPVEQQLRLRVQLVVEVHGERRVRVRDREHRDRDDDGQHAEEQHGQHAAERRSASS